MINDNVFNSDSNQGFKPYKPEQKVVVTITKKEAVLISKMRKHLYGKFTIHKANGILSRIEINDSQLLEEDTEVDLD